MEDGPPPLPQYGGQPPPEIRDPHLFGSDALTRGVDEEAAQEVDGSGGGVRNQILHGGRLLSPERDLGVIGELRQLLGIGEGGDGGGRWGGTEDAMGKSQDPPQGFPLHFGSFPV